MTPAVTQAVLEVPGTPKSFNEVGLRTHWAVGRRHKKQWEADFVTALLLTKVPLGLDSVRATARIEFKQRRRRDEGNFRVLIEKALGDALVGDRRAWPDGRWLPDDTPEHYQFGAVELVAPAPAARTLITIAWPQ